MDTQQVSIFLALLSFLAIAIGAGSLGLLFTGRAETLRPYAQLLMPLALAVAVVATSGSLYYSGIAHFRPCRLCWWQRIMMYPLVPVLGIAALRRDVTAAWYALPLALGGLGYSLYHTQLRWFPDQGASCDADAPCAAVWVDTFNFVSIPFMAAAGFVAISGLLGTQLWLNKNATTESIPPAEATAEALADQCQEQLQ